MGVKCLWNELKPLLEYWLQAAQAEYRWVSAASRSQQSLSSEESFFAFDDDVWLVVKNQYLTASLRNAIEETRRLFRARVGMGRKSFQPHVWLTEANLLTLPALIERWSTIKVEDEDKLDTLVPAYLLWFQMKPGVLEDEIRQLTEEIILAHLSPDWMYWFEQGESALLLAQPLSSLDTGFQLLGSPLADGEESERTSLCQLLYSVIAALESDALLTARVLVSERMDDARLTKRAILSLAMVHQWFVQRHQQEAQQRLLTFAEGLPYLTLMSIDGSYDRLLLHAASSRVNGYPFPLPPDLAGTLQAMMQAHLNVSEAARRMFVHRNTLLNRIERLRESTGYDVRRFEDALSLYLANEVAKRNSHQKFPGTETE